MSTWPYICITHRPYITNPPYHKSLWPQGHQPPTHHISQTLHTTNPSDLRDTKHPPSQLFPTYQYISPYPNVTPPTLLPTLTAHTKPTYITCFNTLFPRHPTRWHSLPAFWVLHHSLTLQPRKLSFTWQYFTHYLYIAWPTNPPTYQPINLSTYQPTNLPSQLSHISS